jgi:hypothetical protein
VLTSQDDRNASRSVQDRDVLEFAAAAHRILLTLNRRHFVRLHQQRSLPHSGIVVCTYDPDFAGQARRVHESIAALGDLKNQIIRVNRPG